MSLTEPTSEELDNLKACIGQRLSIKVHIYDAIWEYGDVESSESDVNYDIELRDVTLDNVVGMLLEDAKEREEGRQYYKGSLMERPFYLKTGVPGSWDAGTYKAITLIQCCDKVLYDRTK